MPSVLIIALSAAAYLTGAVPFGLLIAKINGVDIRTQGSGNIGATNVFRCVGKPWGIACFLLDALKGFIPSFLFPQLVAGIPSEWGLWFGAAAILGHNFPVWLHFKGGKGVATSAGVLLGVAPLAVAVGLLTWAVVFFASGYVSLGSILAAVAVAITGWAAGYGPVTAVALTLLGALAVWRHRSNLQRLLAGTENKFERKKAS